MQCIDYRIMSISANAANSHTFNPCAGLIWGYLTKLVNALNSGLNTPGVKDPMDNFCKMRTCVENIYILPKWVVVSVSACELTVADEHSY